MIEPSEGTRVTSKEGVGNINLKHCGRVPVSAGIFNALCIQFLLFGTTLDSLSVSTQCLIAVMWCSSLSPPGFLPLLVY